MSRRLLLVLAAGLLARVGYGLLFPARLPDGSVNDPDYYFRLASSVADSWTLEEAPAKRSAMREPVYPVLLGLAMKLFGKRYAVVLLLNALLGIAAILVLYAAGRSLLGEAAALTAAAIFALYPPSLYHGAQPMRETLLTLVGALLIWALLEALRRGTLLSFAGVGALGGLAALTNTTLLPFSFILAPASFFVFLRGKALRPAAVYLAALACVYAPWPVRNALVFDRLILGSTAGAGSTFYAYLIVPQEVGGTPRQAEIIAADPVIRSAAGLQPADNERYFWKAGLRWVADHPLSYLKLVSWRFFVDLWRIAPRPRPYEHPRRLLVWVSVLSDGWILPLALAGLILARLKPLEMLLPYLLVLSVSGVYSLILTTIRYRMTAMPWAILLASFALTRGWARWKDAKHAG